MSFLSRFKKKQKQAQPKEDPVLRSKLYLDILTQFEQFEEQGLIALAPLHHRVTVSQQLAALFAKDASTLQSFLNGVSLYGIYQFAHVMTNQVLAKAELEARQKKQQELGRELTESDAKLAKMQAYADSDVSQVINRDIYFDIAVVSPDQEPVVLARVKDGHPEILYVKE